MYHFYFPRTTNVVVTSTTRVPAVKTLPASRKLPSLRLLPGLFLRIIPITTSKEPHFNQGEGCVKSASRPPPGFPGATTAITPLRL